MSPPTFLPFALRSLAPLCLGAVALADVRYVAANGSGQFTTIQAAIDGSLDGDVLLVRSGTYAGFTLDNRSLWIVADDGAQVKVGTTVNIRNLSASASALLSGIQIEGASATWPGPAPNGLRVENNAGHVRVQDCTLRGGKGISGIQYHPLGPDGGNGASVANSSKVAFAGCSLLGGNAEGVFNWLYIGGRGGHGAVTQGSAVAFNDCLLRGGAGGEADYVGGGYTAGDGGDGCQVLDYGIVGSGCQFRGGIGGGIAAIPGNGGDGLVVLAAQAQLIGSTYTGGMGGQGYFGSFGQTGLPQSGSGSFHNFAGAARKLSSTALAAESSAFRLDVTGEPGDRVWLVRSQIPDFVFSPSSAGVVLVMVRLLFANRPDVTLPVTGMASLMLPMPNVGAGTDALRQYWQCVVLDAAGQARLGSPRHVTVLNCSDLLPDCNSNGSCDSCDLLLPATHDCDANGVPDECQPDCNTNGVADVCDIANGTSADLNQNGIPDECEAPTTWYIDANAAPGGNGGSGAPFQALAQAFAAANSGDVLLVAPGVYQGPANRNLDFAGRALVVSGTGGAAGCIIDCQLQGRAFTLTAGVPSGARIQGLTILKGRASSPSSDGGGLNIEHCKPTLKDCVFESCEGDIGGAIRMWQTTGATLDGCTFTGNKSTGVGGAMYAIGAAGFAVNVIDCTFLGNVSSLSGGALHVSGTTYIQRCSFLGNTAASVGGAIHGGSDINVDQCLIAGNSAGAGGGIGGTSGIWRLTNCTLVDNHAVVRGGAVSFGSYFSTLRSLRNNVIWNNTAGVGTPIEVWVGPLDIDWCDIEGGQAAVAVNSQATLIWGPGNIAQDPLFVDADGPDGNPLTLGDNDYRLSLASPCLDAGDNGSVRPDWFDLDGDGNVTEPVPFDFDGNARFVDIPSAPNTGSGTPPLVDLGAWERP